MEIPSDLIPVKGYSHLFRDRATGTIINTDVASIERAKLKKQKRLEERERLDLMENKINSLESKLDLILKKLD